MSKPQGAKELREDRVIGGLCSVMGQVTGSPVRVVDNPDRNRTGRSACDVILERLGRHLAVEVEIVESFRGQMTDDARFREVMTPVQAALSNAFPHDEIVVLLPVGAITTGINWAALSRSLADGLIRELANVESSTPIQLSFPGVPFQLFATRRRPEGNPTATFWRLTPLTEPDRAVRDRLSHAAEQLLPYKEQGLETVVILDSDDVALVSHWDLIAAVAQAWPLVHPAGIIDETFIARSFLNPPHIAPAQVGDRLFPEILLLVGAYMRAQSRL